MHSCRSVLDTGAGINLVRPNVLPANWQSYAEKLERTPRIKDASNNRLIANYAIHIYIDVGCAKDFDRFFVAEHLSVPCILGTEFMDNQVEAIAVCPILADPNRNMSTANNYTIQKFRDLFHALPVNVL